MITRLIYGSILFFGFLLLLYAGHTYVVGILVVVQMILFRELSNVRFKEEPAKHVPLFRTLMWLFFFTAMFYAYEDILFKFEALARYKHYHSWVAFSSYCFLFVLSVLALKKDYYKYQMGQMSWTITVVGLVVFQTRHATSNVFHGLFWFILPCFLIICNDSMAYFVGLAVGRKIVPYPFLELSPNKTWEGFIGGAIFTCILAFILPYFLVFPYFVCPVTNLWEVPTTCVYPSVFIEKTYEFNFFGPHSITIMPVQIHSVLLATFASFIAPFGGFFASAVKRAYSIKDFASVIPGHGGFMDRLDCQLLMALATSIHYQTFIAEAVPAVSTVLSALPQLTPQELKLVAERVQALL